MLYQQKTLSNIYNNRKWHFALILKTGARIVNIEQLLLINNLYSILIVELITASQALAFRRPLKTYPILEDVVNNFRK